MTNQKPYRPNVGIALFNADGRVLIGHRFKGDALPSHFFHRNVFLSFQEDGLGIRDREIIGVDALMWGSDYPHTESTFPRSKEITARVLADVSPGDTEKILAGNVARMFGMNY